MVRKIRVLGIMSCILLSAILPVEKAWSQIWGGAGAGVALPVNKEYKPVGIQAELAGGYRLTPQMAGRVGLGYYRLDFEDGEVLPGITQFQSIGSVYGALQFSRSVGKRFTPYFLGGLGLYDISTDTRVESAPVTPLGDTVVGVLEGISVTKLGFLAGAGLEQVIYEKADAQSSVALSLFVEGKVHFVLTDEPLKLITVSIGIGISL